MPTAGCSFSSVVWAGYLKTDKFPGSFVGKLKGAKDDAF